MFIFLSISIFGQGHSTRNLVWRSQEFLYLGFLADCNRLFFLKKKKKAVVMGKKYYKELTYL